MNLFYRVILLVITTAFLSACSSLDMEPQRVDYRSVRTAPTLEIPPDLTQPQADDRYQMSPNAAASLSSYEAMRQKNAGNATTRAVLPETPIVRMDRAGGQRWLVVDMPAEKVWPLLRQFWEEKGFVLMRDDPSIGIMETDWAENRANLPGGFLRSAIGKVFDRAFDAGERDKYRTRIERSADGKSTEIFISHRKLEEVYVDSMDTMMTGWVFRPSNPEQEAFMMMQLLRFIGFEDKKAQAIVQAEKAVDGDGQAAQQVYVRAKLINNEKEQPVLMLNDGFDRAWRRVGLALDRIGFTVEDRDRAKGVFYVRYIDPEEDKGDTKKGGILSSLAFWKSDKKDLGDKGQYRVFLKEDQGQTVVIVQDKEGNLEESAISSRILNLLYGQLK